MRSLCPAARRKIARALRTPTVMLKQMPINQAIEAAIEKLRERAASIRDVQLPSRMSLRPAVRKARSPESYAYPSRWIKESPEKYQPSTRERILQGTAISAADYAQAHRQIDRLRRSVKDVFRVVDERAARDSSGNSSDTTTDHGRTCFV